MATPISVGQTVHFDVQYDNDTTGSTGQTIANAVLDICEIDLFKLNLYMPYEAKYRDPNPRIVVLIVDHHEDPNNHPDYNAGMNSGYAPKGSTIQINPFASAGVAITADYAGLVFVAEMAELLMTFLGWNEASSQGEGLSRAMAEELHPASMPPSVGGWTGITPVGVPPRRLDFRPAAGPNGYEWISQDEPGPVPAPGLKRGDQDAVAYGCALLFIYFLRYQLDKSYQQICQTPGPTLLNRYQTLTGLNDDPAARLDALLVKHYGAVGFTPAHNNIFPLLDGADRKLSLDFGKPTSKLSQALHQPVSQGIAHIRPMFVCPVGDYPYDEFGLVTTQTITASCIGFGLPNYEWRINGEPLFAEDRSTLRSVSSCNVDVPDPQNPGHPSQHKADFLFSYQVVPSQDKLSSSLTITTQSFYGDYHPVISVYVDESITPTEPVSGNQTLTLSTLSVVYGGNYDADRNKCDSAFQKEISHWVHIQDPLSVLLGPKGDPPRGDLPGVVAAIDKIRSELAHLAASDPGKATRIARYAEQKLGLAPHVLFKRASSAQG